MASVSTIGLSNRKKYMLINAFRPSCLYAISPDHLLHLTYTLHRSTHNLGPAEPMFFGIERHSQYPTYHTFTILNPPNHTWSLNTYHIHQYRHRYPQRFHKTTANLLDAIQAKLDLCHYRLSQRFLILHRV